MIENNGRVSYPARRGPEESHEQWCWSSYRFRADAAYPANKRVHTPSNSAGTHFSAGQRLQL